MLLLLFVGVSTAASEKRRDTQRRAWVSQSRIEAVDRRIQGVGRGVSSTRRREEPAVGRRLSAKSSEIIVDQRICHLRSSVGGGVSLRRGEIRSVKPGFLGRVLQQWTGGYRRVGKEFSGTRRRE